MGATTCITSQQMPTTVSLMDTWGVSILRSIPLEPYICVPLLVRTKWFVSDNKPDEQEVELEKVVSVNGKQS